ncbi:hypothetical protein [Stutzerimonas stutzeri]|uniref:hypothetical protein n=1 Tax=Stutzerimonas stutzeri TaxID=316 RepID=UPI00265D2DCC|nr:hypothetical protein [Stutzerimonas stutzeri]MCF6783722.1 hypothetical protein [Stutzerimonas stutzeri]
MGCSTAAPLRDDPLREQLLRFVADSKYEEAQALPYGLVSGRRLQLGNHDLSKEQLKLVITEQYLDIGRRLGSEFLRNTPAIALEQFAIMAINRDQDTAGLLKSLINSFMVTYLTPETTDRAFSLLLELEALRGDVAQARQQG